MKFEKIKLYVLLLLIFSILPLELLAINLEKAQLTAIKQNKKFLAEQQNHEQSKWNKYKAVSNFLPKLSFNETMVRIDDDTYNEAQKTFSLPVFNSSDNPTGDYVPMSYSALGTAAYRTTYTSELILQQPIFNGGKLIMGYQIAGYANKQARYSLLSKKQELQYNVSEIYFNILKIQDLIQIHEKQIESSESQLNKVKKKLELGMAKNTDVLQWKVKLSNNRINLEQAKNNLEILKSYWRNILGLQDGTELPLPEKIQLKQFEREIKNNTLLTTKEKENKLNKFLTDIKRQNADLRRLKYAQKISKKRYELSKSNLLPSLNLQYTRQFEQDNKLNLKGDDNWNIAAVFSIPLFESGRNITNIMQSRSAYKSTKLEISDTEEKIVISAKNAFLNLITKAKRVENIKFSKKNAEENYTMINDYYNQGLVTNQELIDAEIMLFSVKMQYTNSYYNYIIAKHNIKKYLTE